MKNEIPQDRAFAHLDSALAKLVALHGADDPTPASLIQLALKHLNVDQDENVATVVLLSILLEDYLAELIDGRL